MGSNRRPVPSRGVSILIPNVTAAAKAGILDMMNIIIPAVEGVSAGTW